MSSIIKRIPTQYYLLWLLLLLAVPVRAQQCLLVPVPLAERLAAATWVVEAQAEAPRVVRDAQGHLLTRYGLTAFKVFRGPAGAAVPSTVLLAGGTLGDQGEVVSNTPRLAVGQQGVFFLEPDPQHPGEWRLFAGPQGLISYDLGTRTATEPFGRYAAIEQGLYPALRGPAQPAGYRVLQPNAALAAPVAARGTAGATVVTGFTPTSVAAGTGEVLTITGTDFGATQGTGSVQFLNADNGGSSRVRPLNTDYISWSDTEIRVRVPSETQEGGSAGSGTVQVVSSTGTISTSSASLSIRYSISNIAFSTPSTAPLTALRTKLTNDNGTGGYTLAYGPSFQLGTALNLAARTAFERALTQWACQTGANRVMVNSTFSTATTASDGLNLVTFDTSPATLPAGVLGITYSYYRICVSNVTVTETDYVFANRSDWNFGDHPLANNEYDFESVALHEQGHGIQLDHVINPAAVMHYSIFNGQNKRTLGATDDKAGGRDEVQFSTTVNPATCGPAPGPHSVLVLAGCSPLPVELVSFAGRYEAGRGTQLHWATASERNSAYFAVEAQEHGAQVWTDVLRVAAAGASTGSRSYEARDLRPLSGTRYYRLRQVDADGTMAYSPLVAVTGAESGLAFYPNPVADRLQISGPAQGGKLVLYDPLGREIAAFEFAPGATEVNVSSLHAGLYQAVWTDGHNVRHGRLQKL